MYLNQQQLSAVQEACIRLESGIWNLGFYLGIPAEKAYICASVFLTEKTVNQ
jgi:hypothetical protein